MIKKLDIKSAFSIECGLLGKEFFYKILNSKKIAERYSGDYIELWKEYYRTIKQYVDLTDFCGIIETDSGDIIEISFGTRNFKAEVLSVAETVKKDDASGMYRIIP